MPWSLFEREKCQRIIYRERGCSCRAYWTGWRRKKWRHKRVSNWYLISTSSRANWQLCDPSQVPTHLTRLLTFLSLSFSSPGALLKAKWVVDAIFILFFQCSLVSQLSPLTDWIEGREKRREKRIARFYVLLALGQKEDGEVGTLWCRSQVTDSDGPSSKVPPGAGCSLASVAEARALIAPVVTKRERERERERRKRKRKRPAKERASRPSQ